MRNSCANEPLSRKPCLSPQRCTSGAKSCLRTFCPGHSADFSARLPSVERGRRVVPATGLNANGFDLARPKIGGETVRSEALSDSVGLGHLLRRKYRQLALEPAPPASGSLEPQHTPGRRGSQTTPARAYTPCRPQPLRGPIRGGAITSTRPTRGSQSEEVLAHSFQAGAYGASLSSPCSELACR